MAWWELKIRGKGELGVADIEHICRMIRGGCTEGDLDGAERAVNEDDSLLAAIERKDGKKVAELEKAAEAGRVIRIL